MSWKEWLGFFQRAKQEFDDGSHIKPMNRDFYEYLERDGHRMEVDCGLTGFKKPGRIVYRDSMQRWQPPHDQEPVTEAKQQEILRKFVNYFDRGHASIEIRDS